MKKILIILILTLTLCGCNQKNEEKDIKTIMKENDHVIIDVRSNIEYNSNHIVDAINIPHTEISNIDIDKDKIIFVYCMSGTRSKMAYDALVELGYTIYDLGAFEEIDLPKEN